MKSIKLSMVSLADAKGKLRPGVVTSLYDLQKAGYKLTVHGEDGSPAGQEMLPSVFGDEGIVFQVEDKHKDKVEVEVENAVEDADGDAVENGDVDVDADVDVDVDADGDADADGINISAGESEGAGEGSNASEFDFAIEFDEETNGYILQSPDRTDLIKNWKDIAHQLINKSRTGCIKRGTRETKISVELNLDGTGTFTCNTGLGFFDHMLEQIARHGEIDLDIMCEGDLHVDEHHTIEDVALALGTALDQAFGSRTGIERYGFVLPMDESRATVALDLSGRPFLVFDAHFTRDKVGDLPTEMVKHFFYSLAMNLRATLHIEAKGENDHHIIEAIFKGFARCLKTAKQRTGRGIPSSKGIL